MKLMHLLGAVTDAALILAVALALTAGMWSYDLRPHELLIPVQPAEAHTHMHASRVCVHASRVTSTTRSVTKLSVPIPGVTGERSNHAPLATRSSHTCE